MGKKNFKIIKNCRLCNSNKLFKSFDLGPNPIGDNYTTKKNNSPLMPLIIKSCGKCGFKQLSIVVDEKKVYGNYLYTTSTSKGLTEHFYDSFKFLKKKINLKKKDFVIDIGSNDGSNLKHYKNYGCKVLGVEPAKSLCKISKKKKIKTINGFFDKKIVHKIKKQNKFPKLICIYNLFANVDNLNLFVNNLKKIMNYDTVVVIETFSLAGIINKNLFDNIYHEHISYFHIAPLIKFFEKFNIEIFNVKNNKMKGGSIRFLIRIKRNKNTSLKAYLKSEKNLKLNSSNVFKDLIFKNKLNSIKINKFISKFNKNCIAGYGASCGSTVLVHYYKLKNKFSLFLDDEKRRNNLYSPSANLKVLNPKKKIFEKIKIIIIISWRYEKIIMKNFKKKFPLIYKKLIWYSILPKIKRLN